MRRVMRRGAGFSKWATSFLIQKKTRREMTVKMFFVGFVEQSGANLPAEVTGLSVKSVESGSTNCVSEPKENSSSEMFHF
jgi:hypothetical protein